MQFVFWYKITCLLTGLSIISLGYKLFVKGIFSESGDVEGSFKDYKLIIKKAAPGTYFVLFGSLIIGLVIFKGISTDETLTGANHNHSHYTSGMEHWAPFSDSLKIDSLKNN
jgi:hypothetical protein